MQLAVRLQRCGEVLTADPNDIGSDVVVFGEDQSRRGVRATDARLLAPGIESRCDLDTRVLMFPGGLSGNIQTS